MKRSHFVTENVTVSVPESVPVSVPENVPHNKNETKTTSLVSPNGSTKTKPTFEHGSLPYRAARWLANQIEERLPSCTLHSETIFAELGGGLRQMQSTGQARVGRYQRGLAVFAV